MRALLATGAGDITFADIQEPQPQTNEALVAVRTVSVQRENEERMCSCP